MRISHEAIYQALYVQGRGALKRELTQCLRTGRALRVPQARTRGRGKSFVTSEILIILLTAPANRGSLRQPCALETVCKHCEMLRLPQRKPTMEVGDTQCRIKLTQVRYSSLRCGCAASKCMACRFDRDRH